jgi:hypothetical protein
MPDPSPDPFDVFLSHNSKDKPTVRDIGERLKSRGLKVFLDEWELRPGRPWQEEVEKVIQTTKSFAVVIGKAGFGKWEKPEMRSALNEFANRDVPVIPVLLPGGKDLPPFLKQFTWVDLRGGITNAEIDNLVWGITGVKPGSPPAPAPTRWRRFLSRVHPWRWYLSALLVLGLLGLLFVGGYLLFSRPPTYDLATLVVMHDKAEDKRAFRISYGGARVAGDCFVVKEVDNDCYSVSLEKNGGAIALVEFKRGEMKPQIPKGARITFEGIYSGDLGTGRLSIEQGANLQIIERP